MVAADDVTMRVSSLREILGPGLQSHIIGVAFSCAPRLKALEEEVENLQASNDFGIEGKGVLLIFEWLCPNWSQFCYSTPGI